MFCPKCGNQIKDTAKFCPKCGQPVRAAGQAQQMPSQTAPQPSMQQQAARQTAAAQSPQAQRPRPENPASVQRQPVQEPEPTQKKSPVILILGGVILLIAIGGAAFFIGSQKGSDKAAAEETSSSEDIWDDWDQDDSGEDKNENRSGETTDVTEAPEETKALAETAAPTINLLSGSSPDLTGLTKLNILQSNTTQSSNAEMVDANHIYYAWSAFDGLPETSWQEGRSDDGIGESITAGFGASYPIKALTLRLGNHRSQD